MVIAKQEDVAGSNASNCSDAICFNYGGGRQTVAMCILIAEGVLPKPDCITMADTSRELPGTFAYMEKYTRPLLESVGLRIDVAPHDLSTVDMHGHNGQLLLPVFTDTGKFSEYCSGEWKRRVVERYRRAQGITGGELWLGFAFDEKRRWKRSKETTQGKFTIRCPLVDLMMTTEVCLKLIDRKGWPRPSVSRCHMCPNQKNKEWREVRDNHPELFEDACRIDEEERENDENGNVFLHRSRVPLRLANLDEEEDEKTIKQCSLGMCFV